MTTKHKNNKEVINGAIPVETEKMCVSKREFINLIKNRDAVYQQSQENNMMLKAKLDSTAHKLELTKAEYDKVLDENVKLMSIIQQYRAKNMNSFDLAEYEKKYRENEEFLAKNRDKRIAELRQKLYAKEEKEFMEQLKRERIEKLRKIK